MRCERCRGDGPVERLVVDGYPGHLCGDCYRRWVRFLHGQD